MIRHERGLAVLFSRGREAAVWGLALAGAWSLFRLGQGLSMFSPLILFVVFPVVSVLWALLMTAGLAKLTFRRVDQMWGLLRSFLPLSLLFSLALIIVERSLWKSDVTIECVAVCLGVGAATFLSFRRAEQKVGVRSIIAAVIGAIVSAVVYGLPFWFDRMLTGDKIWKLSWETSIWWRGVLEHHLLPTGEESFWIRLVFLLGCSLLVSFLLGFVVVMPKARALWRGWARWYRWDLLVQWGLIVAIGGALGWMRIGSPTWSLFDVVACFVWILSIGMMWFAHQWMRSAGRMQQDEGLARPTPLTVGAVTADEARLWATGSLIVAFVGSSLLGWPMLFLALMLWAVDQGRTWMMQRAGLWRVWIGSLWAGLFQLILGLSGLFLLIGRASIGVSVAPIGLALFVSGALWYLTRHRGVVAGEVFPGLWLFEHRFWTPGLAMVSALALPVIGLEPDWLLPALVGGGIMAVLAYLKRDSSLWMQMLRIFMLFVMVWVLV